MLAIAIVAVLIAAILITLNLTLLTPTSKVNIDRIEIGMTMDEVEKLLGTPHKQKLIKEIDGYTYESDGSSDNVFTESFLEGLTGKTATIVSATYYYYHGAYGRKLAEISEVEEEIINFDLDAPISQLEKLEDKLAKLEEELKELEMGDVLEIIFEDGEVVEVISNQD